MRVRKVIQGVRRTIRLVGYGRVSQESQADSGVSLAAQSERLREFAAAEGHELAGYLEDAGISAGSLDRPALRSALGMIDDGAADGLLALRLDRVTRCMEDWCWLSRTYFAPPRSVPPVLMSGAVDLRTAGGRFAAMIQVAVSEYEIATGKERTAFATQHKRSKGHAIGHAPFGQRVGPDGKTLEPDPGELGTIALMRELKAEGRAFRAIAAELDARGIPARRGGRWDHKVISRILQSNPTDGGIAP